MVFEGFAGLAENLTAHAKLPGKLLVGFVADEFGVKIVADDRKPHGGDVEKG